MKKLIGTLVVGLILVGCSTAAHYGETSASGGLEVKCGGGCAEYRSNGSGCAVFTKDTSASCGVYFEKACKSSPASCKNN